MAKLPESVTDPYREGADVCEHCKALDALRKTEPRRPLASRWYAWTIATVIPLTLFVEGAITCFTLSENHWVQGQGGLFVAFAVAMLIIMIAIHVEGMWKKTESDYQDAARDWRRRIGEHLNQ
jgi:hypothetical protein